MDFAGGVLAMSAVDNHWIHPRDNLCHLCSCSIEEGREKLLPIHELCSPCSLTQTQKTEMVSGSVAKSIQSKEIGSSSELFFSVTTPSQ